MLMHDSITRTIAAGLAGTLATAALADPPVVEPQVTLLAEAASDFDALGVASAIGAAGGRRLEHPGGRRASCPAAAR